MAFDSKLYELMIDRVQDYAIFLLDPGGHVMSWNAGAQRIELYQADEIVGRHVSLFYTEDDRARSWAQTELRRAAIDGRFEDSRSIRDSGAGT